MADPKALLKELAEVHSDEWPLLTVSLDLTPGPEGIAAARQILKHGWRAAEEAYDGDLTSRDALRSYEVDQGEVETLQEEAIARGSRGLYYAGCAATDLRVVIETPYPMRNSVCLSHRPWLFELLRYEYLVHRPVTLALVDLPGIRVLKVAYGEVDEEIEVQRWDGPVTGPHGRTDTQGVGSMGSDAGGPGPAARSGQATASDVTGGWHGKTRIEKSILAHKEAFAREDAARLREFVNDGELLVIAGPVEPRAELLQQLSGELREIAVEAPNLDPTLSDSELEELATELVVEEQYRRAERELHRWQSGELGARAIEGAAAVQHAIERGQLDTLILPEDIAPSLGTATDARARPGGIDMPTLDEVIRGALATSAQCFVVNELANEQGGTSTQLPGILRWL